ncbi:MAG: hypothetical protein H7Z19_07060, partial [Chitinophagaceae bacterium]|nr:hypothetical protein [Rubrivivax sp.]
MQQRLTKRHLRHSQIGHKLRALTLASAIALGAGAACAQTVRFATFNASLNQI